MLKSNLDSLITFCSLNSNYLDQPLLASCAFVYCQIWREPPWNEDFWTVTGVLNDLGDQMNRPGFIGFLSLSRIKKLEVIGFTWGYQVDFKELAQIASNPELSKIFASNEKYFYIDELGVISNYRRKNIGKMLTKLLIKEVFNQGIRKLVLRTDKKALAARNLYQEIGFKELPAVDGVYKERSYWLLDL